MRRRSERRPRCRAEPRASPLRPRLFAFFLPFTFLPFVFFLRLPRVLLAFLPSAAAPSPSVNTRDPDSATIASSASASATTASVVCATASSTRRTAYTNARACLACMADADSSPPLGGAYAWNSARNSAARSWWPCVALGAATASPCSAKLLPDASTVASAVSWSSPLGAGWASRHPGQVALNRSARMRAMVASAANGTTTDSAGHTPYGCATAPSGTCSSSMRGSLTDAMWSWMGTGKLLRSRSRRTIPRASTNSSATSITHKPSTHRR